MSSPKNVLFMYLSNSSGHQRAAEAVMSALADINPDVRCAGVDPVGRVYPVIGRIVSRMYIEMLKFTPEIWDFLYDNPAVEGATRELREFANIFSARKLSEILREYRPHCVVCTQAMPATALASLKKRGKTKVPIVGIVTDFGVHSYWLSRAVDLYMVGDEQIKRKMVRRGIKESHILVTGIPVDPSFTQNSEKSAERARLGLDPHASTLLVTGGGRGLGPLTDVVDALRKLPMPHQIIVVAGNNKQAQRKLHKYFSHDPHVKILGFTKHMSRLMDAADLIISKPGGLTSAECLAKGLPMVMFKPIPGQEEWNAKYLSRQGAGQQVDTLDELYRTVHRLLSHPEQIEKMREKARRAGKPYAAYECGQALLNLITSHAGRAPRADTTASAPFGRAPLLTL